jgi:hypothetical protein
VEFVVRDQRRKWWPLAVFICVLFGFWFGAGCLGVKNLPTALSIFLVFSAALAFIGGIFAAVIVQHRPIESLAFGVDFVLRPSSECFSPSEITQIRFAADPQEDYCDEPGRLWQMEVGFHPISCHRCITVIVTDEDVDQVTSWAERSSVAVVDMRPKGTGKSSASEIDV